MSRSDERKEFLSDIIIIAIEGGIGYWSVCSNYKHDDGKNVTVTIQEIVDESTDELGPEVELNNDVIATGIGRIIRGEVEVNDRTRKLIAGASATNDAGDLDINDCDCIVQAAVLNELVYG